MSVWKLGAIMLDQHIRNLLFFDLTVRQEPDYVRRVPLIDILRQLEPHVANGDCRRVYASGTEQMTLKELEIHEAVGVAVMLFQYCNTRVTDPAFLNLDSGLIRVAGKEPREGIAVSAHAAVALQETNGVQGYTMLLEDVPGIGKSNITDFLIPKIRKHAVYTYRDRDGERKKLKFSPAIHFNQGEVLRDALQRGRVSGLELISYEPAGFDADGVELKKLVSHSALAR
jgi:hypothetical protein